METKDKLIEKLKEWLLKLGQYDCHCDSCTRFRSEIAVLEKQIEEQEAKNNKLWLRKARRKYSDSITEKDVQDYLKQFKTKNHENKRKI